MSLLTTKLKKQYKSKSDRLGHLKSFVRLAKEEMETK